MRFKNEAIGAVDPPEPADGDDEEKLPPFGDVDPTAQGLVALEVMLVQAVGVGEVVPGDTLRFDREDESESMGLKHWASGLKPLDAAAISLSKLW